MKLAKLFKQNRMATEWGPAYPISPTLPHPLRVKRGVLDQVLPALRLATGNGSLRDADAIRAIAGLVEKHLPRLQALLKGGTDMAQFPVALQTPVPLSLHLAYAENTLWVSDQPLLPYPPPREEY
jgi:hypothetical protein